jgi:IMP dehydrogenase
MSLFTFSDICIDDQYSDVLSRSDVYVSTDMGKFKLRLPVISANMPNVTENKMAIEMASCGGLGILHRFMTVEENVNQYKMAQKGIRSVNLRDSESYIGVSIGVKDGERLRFDRLYEAGARIFCIDIAHGHCAMMKEMITWIRNYNYRDIVIIAGNIATKRAALDLVEWGADIIKVGIGPGSVCITRRNT